jgi:hypothetical protein
MLRSFLFLLGFLFLVTAGYAQGGLTGRVYENKSRIPIAGVGIQNLSSHVNTVSDKNGLFSIRAHVGDLVTFSAFSYQTDTLYVKDLGSVEILLDLKQNLLKGVDIGASSNVKIGSLTAAPTLSPFGGQTVVYQKDASGNYTGGLTANIFDSHSAANKRKKDAQLGKDENTKQEIANVFSPENLKNYVPIEGQELDNFIMLYIPDIDTYTSPEFNLAAYVNSCYKEFRKIPLEKRQSKEFLQLNGKSN